MRTLLFFFILLLTSPAWAQNTTCATRPPGDSSNACASTAFVQNNVAPGIFQASTFGVNISQTDNGPLINTALTYCNANGGGTVQLPTGVLNIVTPIQLVTDCYLKGAGRGSPQYPGATPPSNPVTMLNWQGSAGAPGVVQANGNNTNWITHTGLATLSINGNVANPTTNGTAGLYLNGWVNVSNFENIDIYNIPEGVHEDAVSGSSYGIPSRNEFGYLGIYHVNEGLRFTGGTSEHYQHVDVFGFYSVGIDFVTTCDSNSFDWVTLTSYDAVGSVATGIIFNSGSPYAANDVYSEQFNNLFLNMTQNATENSIIVWRTDDGGANTISNLELGYQAVMPVIHQYGILQYNTFNGFDLRTSVMSWQTRAVSSGSSSFQLPTLDATSCGATAVVDPRSTANRGIVTVGPAANACIVYFPVLVNGLGSTPWPPGSSPVCTVTDYTRANALWLGGIPFSTQLTVHGLSGGDQFGWICF